MKWWTPRLQTAVMTEDDAGQRRAAALTGEELTRIFTQLRPSLERVITRRTGDAQAAQDLAQDLYLRFQRVADQLPTEDEARRYLMRMATNAAIDHLRAEGYRMQLLVGALTLFDEAHAPDPASNAEIQEQYQIIGRVLGDLPPLCGDVLYMSRIEGLTHPEIAERLGLSVSSVEKYVMRALKHCRAKLEGP